MAPFPQRLMKGALMREGHVSPKLLGISTFSKRRGFATSLRSPRLIPSLEAPHLSLAQHCGHVRHVAEQLKTNGLLKINLGFPDSRSRYLQQLCISLHENCGHQLPITHSETRGWFWDIRPSATATTDTRQTLRPLARSETMELFPWHTDCSYEEQPPRYFALQVLRPDRCGGGSLSILDVGKLGDLLSPATRAALMRQEYRVTTPPEFLKASQRSSRVISIAAPGEQHGRGVWDMTMRYREDILMPLSEGAARALRDVREILSNRTIVSRLAFQVTATDLPEQSILVVDNRRWLHARTRIRDPERHLRRVRWDAAPF